MKSNTINIISYHAKAAIIDFFDKSPLDSICNIFQCNDKGELKIIQENNHELQTKINSLNEYAKTDATYHQIIAWFRKLKENEKVILQIGKIIDTRELMLLYHKAAVLNNIPSNNINTHPIFEKYNIVVYVDGSRKNIGNPIKENRICRFCGKQLPEVTFNDTSHAISECLGKNGVVCKEECDSCNKKFSETIEVDIYNKYALSLFTYKISGKDGVRTIIGNNCEFRHDNQGGISIKFTDSTTPPNIEELKSEWSPDIDLSNLTWSAQNIYKCLSKYALSVVPRKLLEHCKGTIDWINSEISEVIVPTLIFTERHFIEKKPNLAIWVRKNDDCKFPYMFCSIQFANIEYIYIITFTSKDTIDFTNKENFDFFLNNIKEWFCRGKYSIEDMSDTVKSSTAINFNVITHCENTID